MPSVCSFVLCVLVPLGCEVRLGRCLVLACPVKNCAQELPPIKRADLAVDFRMGVVLQSSDEAGNCQGPSEKEAHIRVIIKRSRMVFMPSTLESSARPSLLVLTDRRGSLTMWDRVPLSRDIWPPADGGSELSQLRCSFLQKWHRMAQNGAQWRPWAPFYGLPSGPQRKCDTLLLPSS